MNTRVNGFSIEIKRGRFESNCRGTCCVEGKFSFTIFIVVRGLNGLYCSFNRKQKKKKNAFNVLSRYGRFRLHSLTGFGSFLASESYHFIICE